MSWLLLAVAPPLAVACVADVRWRIIPDGAGAALALAGMVAAAQAGTLLTSIAVGAAGLLVGGLAAWRGLWGLGDAKLLGAAGVVVGASGFLPLLFFTSLGGALLALALMAVRPLARGRFASPPHNWPRWLRNELRRLRRAPTVPYGLAIAGGVVATLATAG